MLLDPKSQISLSQSNDNLFLYDLFFQNHQNRRMTLPMLSTWKETMEIDNILASCVRDPQSTLGVWKFWKDKSLSNQVNLGSDLWVRMSLSEWVRNLCWDLTDATLADEDANSKLNDNANRAIKGNVVMHVRRPGGQLWNQYLWGNLMTTWWPNLQLMHVAPPGGPNWN